MTAQQRAFLLMLLHTTPNNQRKDALDSQILNFGLSVEEKEEHKKNIEISFNNGIGNINLNQLNNLLKIAEEKEFSSDAIKTKLRFYGVDSSFDDYIIEFFRDYIQSNKEINVGKLDNDFKGVQVASRDNFNTIINQGWTGDWDLQPHNINPRRIQVASMNETGPFPRGCYLNADIIDTQPIQYDDKIRYRIFIANPIVVNTGNRNVKFSTNPVRYIK